MRAYICFPYHVPRSPGEIYQRLFAHSELLREEDAGKDRHSIMYFDDNMVMNLGSFLASCMPHDWAASPAGCFDHFAPPRRSTPDAARTPELQPEGCFGRGTRMGDYSNPHFLDSDDPLLPADEKPCAPKFDRHVDASKCIWKSRKVLWEMQKPRLPMVEAYGNGSWFCGSQDVNVTLVFGCEATCSLLGDSCESNQVWRGSAMGRRAKSIVLAYKKRAGRF